ncbi:TIR domain-containing protein [Nocardia aurea]|uniref:TIR domain-containing protein n=1 Tax=Nocardia aurea TaxID=2144174 RepID=A0ABV3FSQ5_9NOCA
MCAHTAQNPQLQAREREGVFEYDAFISYTHFDRPVAAGIQKGLHRIGRRMGRLRALRVFRDATDLTANPDLWGDVTSAMIHARYLIVVVSPAAVASGWVNKEVSHWLQRHGPDRLLFVVADGHLTWDEEGKRFDPLRSDAALPVLTEPGALVTEPFYVDVSEDAPWDPRAPMFREKVTDLAAPIHGKPKYDLAGEDLRELRRFRRLRRAVIVGLVVLTVLAITAAMVAFAQREDALRKRDRAIALQLVADGHSMLAGTRPGGDARALKQILAAHSIGSQLDDGALLDATLARQGLREIIETAATDVQTIVLSPDQQRVVTGGTDGTVRRWDPHTGAQIGAPLTGHNGEVEIVLFSADGRRIVSSDDHTVRVWDADTGAPIGSAMSVKHPDLTTFDVSADGRRVVTGSFDLNTGGFDTDGTVEVWDANTGKLLSEPMTGERGRVSNVGFAPDGRRIATAGADGTVRVWDADTGSPIGEPIAAHDNAATSVAFSADGRRIASGGDDGTVCIWDTDSGNPIGATISGHKGAVPSVAFSPSGRLVVSGGADGTVRIWDSQTGTPRGEPMTGHEDWVFYVAFSPDGQRIISGGGRKGTLRVWDADIRSAEQGTVRSLAYTPDGNRYVSGGADGTLQLWDAHSSAPVGEPVKGHSGEVRSVASSPDGRFASAGSDGTVQLWAADPLRPIGTGMTGHRGRVLGVAFSPDGRSIASAGQDGSIRLWDADTRMPVGAPVTGHEGVVTSVAFAADGRSIASAGTDGTVRLWDSATGRSIGGPITGHQSRVDTVVFSPDGQRIAAAGVDGVIRVWDPRTRRRIAETEFTGPLARVAFAPDGRTIASAGYDRSVRLWDSRTGRSIGAPMTGHADAVKTVAFSPDGRWIVSGGGDDQIWKWATKSEDWSATLCAKIKLNMSHRQWREWVSPDIDYVAACPGLPIPPDDPAGK